MKISELATNSNSTLGTIPPGSNSGQATGANSNQSGQTKFTPQQSDLIKRLNTSLPSVKSDDLVKAVGDAATGVKTTGQNQQLTNTIRDLIRSNPSQRDNLIKTLRALNQDGVNVTSPQGPGAHLGESSTNWSVDLSNAIRIMRDQANHDGVSVKLSWNSVNQILQNLGSGSQSTDTLQDAFNTLPELKALVNSADDRGITIKTENSESPDTDTTTPPARTIKQMAHRALKKS